MLGSYQPSHALLERKQRLGALNVSKAASSCSFTLLYASPKYRVIGRRKRQFIDKQHRQGLPRNIHALPKARTANQNGVAMLSKKFQHGFPAAFALHKEQAVFKPVGVMRSKFRRSQAYCAKACAKNKKPATQFGENAFQLRHAQQ